MDYDDITPNPTRQKALRDLARYRPTLASRNLMDQARDLAQLEGAIRARRQVIGATKAKAHEAFLQGNDLAAFALRTFAEELAADTIPLANDAAHAQTALDADLDRFYGYATSTDIGTLTVKDIIGLHQAQDREADSYRNPAPLIATAN